MIVQGEISNQAIWVALITGVTTALISIGGGLVAWGALRQKITDRIDHVESEQHKINDKVETERKISDAVASKLELRMIDFDSNNRSEMEKLEKEVQVKLQRIEKKQDEVRDMVIQIATRLDIKPMFKGEGD